MVPRAWRPAIAILVCLFCRTTNASHYTTLGVGKSASAQEIKTAYRKLAIKYHPDKQTNPRKQSMSDNMESVNEAYETLSDPDRRRKYDQQLAFGGPYSSTSGRAPHPGSFGGAHAYYHQFGGVPRGFGSDGAQHPFFRPRPAVPPPRASRPFYCSLTELAEGGGSREFHLADSPLSRLRDAWHDGLEGAAREALMRTASIAASLCWRFPSLLLSRRLWFLRLPALVVAFAFGVSQQLPPSPRGTFAFDIQPGWRAGTKVVFPAAAGARAAAFELRERRHPRLRRKGPSAAGDVLYRARPTSFAKARRGTHVQVIDLEGAAHDVELTLTAEEVAERRETVLRKVGDGLGLPRKRAKGELEGGRGALWVHVALAKIPRALPEEEDREEEEGGGAWGRTEQPAEART